MTVSIKKSACRFLRLFGIVPMMTIAWSCSFDVSNPGPVDDESLDDPDSFQAIVNGAGRTLGEGLNYVVLHGAAVARELHPTGQTGQFGIEPLNSVGILSPEEQNTPWSNTHRARWIAEDGLRRMEGILSNAEFESSEIVAEGFVWAGYANRLLGENFCQAVFDGGAPEDGSAYLTRSEDQFTRAIQIATATGRSDLATAATAARAAVRVHMGDWTGAVSDASSVATDFEFVFPFFDIGNTFFFNRVAWASLNQPFKAHTQWGTFYEQYFTDTSDPRVPYLTTNDVGTGALECCGAVPWFPQTKYDKLGGFPLSTGREMRLIEAEAMLRDGMWPEAMIIINGLRTDIGMAPWTAGGLDEAWTRLKRERGIELWLEGRRLGDLRRWQEGGTPGDLDATEVVGVVSHLDQQDLCFPIPRNEIDTNPNIPG